MLLTAGKRQEGPHRGSNTWTKPWRTKKTHKKPRWSWWMLRGWQREAALGRGNHVLWPAPQHPHLQPLGSSPSRCSLTASRALRPYWETRDLKRTRSLFRQVLPHLSLIPVKRSQVDEAPDHPLPGDPRLSYRHQTGKARGGLNCPRAPGDNLLMRQPQITCFPPGNFHGKRWRNWPAPLEHCLGQAPGNWAWDTNLNAWTSQP